MAPSGVPESITGKHPAPQSERLSPNSIAVAAQRSFLPSLKNFVVLNPELLQTYA
jgi:hypothetical protein